MYTKILLRESFKNCPDQKWTCISFENLLHLFESLSLVYKFMYFPLKIYENLFIQSFDTF